MLWPAATVRQAREFYNKVDKTAFLSLDEWKIKPALHFSYIQSIPIKATTACSTEKYFDYFADGLSPYGQMDEATLVPLAKQWENEGLITSDNLRKLNEVIDLEDQGKLEDHIIEAIKTPLSSWGETLCN